MTRMKSNWMTPNADKYAEAAVRTIGYARHTTGYFPHAIMQLIINSMHYLFPHYSNNFILKNMEKTRAKALKKSMKE